MSINIGVPAQPEDESKKNGDSVAGDVVSFIADAASPMLNNRSNAPRVPATDGEPVLDAAAEAPTMAAAEAATAVGAEATTAGAEAATSVAEAVGTVAGGVVDFIGGILSG